MSQWDFGHGREPTEHHEPQYPQQPPHVYPAQPGAEYPYGQDPGYGYPQEAQYEYPQAPPGPQYPTAQPAPEPYAQDPDYPYPYAPPPAEPGPPAYFPTRRGGPTTAAGRAPMSTRAGASPMTRRPGTRSPTSATSFEGRASLPAAPGPDLTPPYTPWPDAAGAGRPFRRRADHRFAAEPPASPWRPRRRPRSPTWARRTRRGRGTRAGRRATRTATSPTAAAAVTVARGRRPVRPGTGTPGRGRRATRGNGTTSRPDRGRWLIPAALAVAGAAVGAAIVMIVLGHAHAAAGTTAPTAGASSTAGAAGAAGAAGRRRPAGVGRGRRWDDAADLGRRPERAVRLHDRQQQRQRPAQRLDAGHGRNRRQLRHRRRPVHGPGGRRGGPVRGVRPGRGDLLHPPGRGRGRDALVRRAGLQRVRGRPGEGHLEPSTCCSPRRHRAARGRTRSSPTCFRARTPRTSRSAVTGSRRRSAPPRRRSRSRPASSPSGPRRQSTAPGPASP